MKLILVALFLAFSCPTLVLGESESFSGFGFRAPASPGGKTQCFTIVNKILDKDKFIGGPRFEFSPDSILGRYPQLKVLIEDLNIPQIDLVQTVRGFHEHHSRVPTLREVLEISYKQREALLRNYNTLIDELRKVKGDEEVDSFLAEVLMSKERVRNFKDIDQIDLEVRSSFESGKSSIQSLDRPVKFQEKILGTIDDEFYKFLNARTSLGQFYGEYGELVVMASFRENILKKGLLFRALKGKELSSYEKMIFERVSDLRVDLEQKNLDELMSFVESFSSGITKKVKGSIQVSEPSTLEAKEIVAKIMNIIESKEIDLVRKTPSGQTIWTEVKAYSRTINKKTLEGGDGKTLIEQLQEHSDLRRLLGLESEVELEFVSPISQVTDEARQMIESLGYRVISAK